MFGFLNINKPSGITSHKIISQLRKITKIKRIGHAGTLDPLASGVLPVAVGKAAKLIDYLNDEKSYSVTMIFGKTSDTFDTDGVISDVDCDKITIERINELLPQFKGTIKQIPPAFSAVHYNGKRLYELARNGIIPDDIPSREVIVSKIQITEFDYENQILKMDIDCSKGTYIRSIVNDLGEATGCGAVMSKLVRTASSGFNIGSSFSLSDDTDIDFIKLNLINPASVLNMPVVKINDVQRAKLLNGNKFAHKSNLTGNILLSDNCDIVAIAFSDNEFIQPKKVFL